MQWHGCDFTETEWARRDFARMRPSRSNEDCTRNNTEEKSLALREVTMRVGTNSAIDLGGLTQNGSRRIQSRRSY